MSAVEINKDSWQEVNSLVQTLEKFGLKVTGGECKDCEYFDKTVKNKNECQWLCQAGSFTNVYDGDVRLYVSANYSCKSWKWKKVSER